ncbi:MAG TPA: ChaB family protein [Leptolyngbyaceae cyanobacterium]
MPYQQVSELPQEIRDQLPQHGQNIFLAAFNAAQSDGMSEEGARDVAWNSVRMEYEQGKEGQWQRKDKDTATHNKSITTGGN